MCSNYINWEVIRKARSYNIDDDLIQMLRSRSKLLNSKVEPPIAYHNKVHNSLKKITSGTRDYVCTA